jgi:septal ring factor EnvC (AmiA/AmiB activator)
MICRFPRGGVVLLAGLLLAGCSFFSHSVTWTKSGTSEDQAQSDLAACKEQADTQTDRDAKIDQDIASATAAPNGIDQSPIQNIQNFRSQNRYKSILADCMQQNGYRKVD